MWNSILYICNIRKADFFFWKVSLNEIQDSNSDGFITNLCKFYISSVFVLHNETLAQLGSSLTHQQGSTISKYFVN